MQNTAIASEARIQERIYTVIQVVIHVVVGPVPTRH